MTDRTPGSSWTNPIWYRRYRIYQSDTVLSPPWAYVHDDYDGAEDAHDHRHGYAGSVIEAKVEIDELEADLNAQ